MTIFMMVLLFVFWPPPPPRPIDSNEAYFPLYTSMYIDDWQVTWFALSNMWLITMETGGIWFCVYW